MLQSFRLGLVPFSDLFDGFVANLHTSTAIILDIPRYGGKFIDGGLWDDVGTDAKSVDLDVKDIDDPVEWQLWSLDYLLDSAGTVHAGDLPFPCACGGCGAPSSSRAESRTPPKQRTIQSSRSFRGLVARNEQLLTFGVVVAVLQLFLHVTRATATPLLLPTLSPAAARAALAVVNAAGVLGSAVATRRYGREATCAVSAALIVFCQVRTSTPCLITLHGDASPCAHAQLDSCSA